MKKILVSMLVVLLELVPVSIFAEDQNVALSAGLGLVYPLCDFGDAIDYAVSLPVNVQYAVIPNLSLELDGYYYIYTTEAESGWDVS